MKSTIDLAACLLLAVSLGACGGACSVTPAPAPVSTPTPAPAAADADADTLAAPRGLDIQPLSATELMLSWTDASGDETGFRIERRNPGASWTQVGVAHANASRFRDTGLSAGTSYAYRVSAVRATGVLAAASAPAVKMPAAAVQSVFYVDSANGADAGPGTEARPWKTLQRAADVLAPGQTVLVRHGAYTSSDSSVVSISKSGADGAWITYRNFPGERPRITATMRKNRHGIEIRCASHIVVDGFEIEGRANGHIVVRHRLTGDHGPAGEAGPGRCDGHTAPADGNAASHWKNNNYTARALVASNIIIDNVAFTFSPRPDSRRPAPSATRL